MKEPKFRAWDDEVKHMYYPPNEHICLEMTGYCLNLQTGKRLIPLFWTGLKDKNGREIWEGDIVKWVSTFYGASKDEHIDTVKWDEERAWFYLHPWVHELFSAECEVIGNVYENPELIGG